MKVLDKGSPEVVNKVVDGELAVNKAAEQIRKEEEDKKKPPEDTPVEDPPAFDADNAVEVYDEAEASLLNALVALANASGVGHARDKAKTTKERLDEAIADAVRKRERRK